jgi:Tat protein secretion system quality control protein TatD with DNase activity
MWIDSHCHVSADEFAADRAAVLARGWEAGLDALVAIGARGVDASAGAVALGRKTRASSRRSASTPRRAAAGRRRTRGHAAGSPRRVVAVASAASTTGTSTRRDRCSATSSPGTSRSRARSTGPS